MSTRMHNDRQTSMRSTEDEYLHDAIGVHRRTQYIKGTVALIIVAAFVALLVYGFMDLAAVA